MKVFVQDPQIFMTALEIGVPGLLDPDEPAVIDTDHRSRINWETYFFTCRDNKAMFDADPLANCGMLTDPVTRMRFEPTAESPHMVHDGTSYYFQSDSTHAVFASMPDSLAVPVHRMRPKMDG